MSDHSTSLDGRRRSSPQHYNIGEEQSSSLQIQRLSNPNMKLQQKAEDVDVLSMSMPGNKSTTNHINGSTHIIGNYEYQRRHSTNNNNNLRRRGINTKDACEVNRRRGMACAEEENDKPPRRKSRRRRSLVGGIRYGAAAVKRGASSSDDGEVGSPIDDSHRSVGSSKGRSN